VCPADGEICELADAVDIGEHPLLPCMRCRVAERAARELKRWKPGRYQAEALLAAAPGRRRREWPYAGSGIVFDPRVENRSEKEKRYEACRALRERGLLYARPPKNPSHGGKMTLWRTPLGEAVLAAHEDAVTARSRNEIIPLVCDREAMAAATRLPTEKLKEIFEVRRSRVPDGLHDSFEEQLHGKPSNQQRLEIGAQKAALLITNDEVDTRLSRRAVRSWGADATRANTAIRAHELMPAVRRAAAGRRKR
jgi:hypothetical protein